MRIGRILRHLTTIPLFVRRRFTQHALDAIESAIAEGERTHDGQVRFAVESALDLPALFRGTTARERAIEVFSELRVWDTERNSGVLLYVLLADHDVEIVADRGVDAAVGSQAWEDVCRVMEAGFRRGDFEKGAVDGIRAVSALLAKHCPPRSGPANELPDRPEIV